jgi:uncharacterized protein (DUF433 family)
VLSVIRRFHGVKMPRVRQALDFLRGHFQTPRPLLHPSFFTDGKSLFIERLGNVVNLSEGGQMEMKRLLEAYLKRVKRDESGVPLKLFPFSTSEVDASKPVSIDPRVQFGKPCIAGTRIPTAIIAERHEAGDTVEQLAEDYERSPEEIERAILYERARAA